jgi:hypothetical protein
MHALGQCLRRIQALSPHAPSARIVGAASTFACTIPRAHRFAEVSRLTEETERLVDENVKLRGVIDELRSGHSELQSDTERREAEAQRIVQSTQKVIAELNQKLVGLQEELESKHARTEWLLVEKEWKEKDIEQANKRTLLFSERARQTEAELAAYKTEHMKLQEELAVIKKQWQEWEEWRHKRPAQMMDEIEKLRLQLEDQKKPRPPNGLFWDRKDIAELESERDQSRTEAEEYRQELAKLRKVLHPRIPFIHLPHLLHLSH